MTPVKFIFDNHSDVVALCEQLADDIIEFTFTIEKGDFVITVTSPIQYKDTAEAMIEYSTNKPEYPIESCEERPPDPYLDDEDEYIDLDDEDDFVNEYFD